MDKISLAFLKLQVSVTCWQTYVDIDASTAPLIYLSSKRVCRLVPFSFCYHTNV